MRQADAPLQKITINIYLDDYLFYKSRYGVGWQEVIRLYLREKAKQLRAHDVERD